MTSTPSLPSFSTQQLARRWGLTEDDVADLIRTGVLKAHALLHQEIGEISSIERVYRVFLDGHYALPLRSAVALLDGRERVEEPHRATIYVEDAEPGKQASIVFHDTSLLGRNSLRVLSAEVDRYEREPDDSPRDSDPGSPPERKLSNMQRRKERCRAIAALLWSEHPDLTIEDMIDRDEIAHFGQENASYHRKTIRNWINDLCPNRGPGRRPKKA